MTHEYTILVGGLLLGASDARSPATAIAWAADTVLAVGGDAAVLAISRGDSKVVDLRGALIRPVDAPLEVGSPADFEVLAGDPPTPIALVRAGRVIAGELPGRRAIH